MTYQLEAPARARSALQAAAGSYGELELRPTEDDADVRAGGPDVGGEGSGGEGERLSPLAGDPDGEGEAIAAEAYGPDRVRADADVPASVGGGDGPDPLGVDDEAALGDVPEEASAWWGQDPGPER